MTHLSLDLFEHLPDLLIAVHLPNSFTTTSPAGLEHDRIANTLAGLNGLIRRPHTGLQMTQHEHKDLTYKMLTVLGSTAKGERNRLSIWQSP